ncbi:MAG TPA: alpha-2-macroglobulin family protein, partial [Bacteroidia bacterium]|nr:alpha-2-macroglobulin family protein [Bacteroidia bacterium]
LTNYQASLQNADSLQKMMLDKFDVIIVKGNARELRPTLYDLLAHRALDFYKSEEPDITRPADQFAFTDSAYLGDYEQFSKLDLKTTDTLSLKFYALQVFQKLIEFHSSKKEIAPLVDIDLERLDYIYAQVASMYNKDSIYMHSLERLKSKFISYPASTEVDYQIASLYYASSASNRAFNDVTRWYKKKALGICEETTKRFPDSFGAINCNALASQIKEKYIAFSVPQVSIPNQVSLASVSFQNVKKVYVRIVKLNPEKYADMYQYEYYNKLPKEWVSAAPTKEWTIELPEEKDYQDHSIEVKVPGLSPGFYVVMVSGNDKFTCDNNQVVYHTCWVSNISYVSRDLRDGSKEYTVLDRTDGKPMKNVSVQVWYTNEYDYTARKYKTIRGPLYTTNDDGHFVVHPQKDKYVNYRLDFTTAYNYDRLREWDNNYLYYQEYSKPTMYPHDYFYTDRAIYRPGQTVYFKGILTESDCEKTYLDTGRATNVTLYDVNYQRVTSLDLKADAYGAVSGMFVLPMGLLNGQMRITNEYGTVYIHVEDYKRPKFYVNMDTVKGNYRLGEKVTVTGSAKGYNGASIDGASVKYSITRRSGWSYWWYGYFWDDYYSSNSASTQIASGTVMSNDTGGFVINFNAAPDLNVSKRYRSSFIYTVSVDVTDENGETHSSQTDVKVSYAAVNLDVQIPQQVEKAATDSFMISVENMAGSTVSGSGSIKIYKLEEPPQVLHSRLWSAPDTAIYTKAQWDTLFPYEPYGRAEGITSWNKGERLVEQSFNTANKKYFKIPGFSSWKAGTYVMEAHTTDKYGEDVKDTKYFIVYSIKEKTIPLNTPDWYNAVKEYCEPGEKAQYLIGSAYDNVTILFEIERKNKTVHKEWLTLNHEQRLIEIPVADSDRGGFAVHFVCIKNNRAYTHDGLVTVPWSNKDLSLKFESFRDKLLPGQKEVWRIKIKDKDGNRVAAQMMATLYDASLDEFAANSWLLNIYPTYGSTLSWRDPQIFGCFEGWSCTLNWNIYAGAAYRSYDQLISPGYYYSYYQYYGGGYSYRSYRGARMAMEEDDVSAATGEVTEADGTTDKSEKKASMHEANTAAAPAAIANQVAQSQTTVTKTGGDNKNDAGGKEKDNEKDARSQDLSKVTARTNFNETAFFYPQLMTDDSGNVVIQFTIPEATTKWKMMGLAHTKDLKIGYIQNQLVTQKDLMITANAPRFLRENDTISYTAKITNLADKDLSGTAQLFLQDALDSKDISSQFGIQQLQKPFSVKKGLSTVVTWQLIVPSGIDAVTYKVVAQAGNYSDGEQNTMPVLTNSMLVTESVPLSVRGKQKRVFTFDKLVNQNNHSTTLRNHKVTLEFTPNPAWYAIQALPYIMEYPYECAEQTFERFYSNSIATNIVNSSPRVKAVFESWKNRSTDAFLSNLEKNQELKTLMLEETPWVLEAQDEGERKKRVGVLFDLNRMSNELSKAL